MLAPPLTLLVRVVVAGRQDRFQVLNDDAYYYLGVARSLADGHGSTFTGLTETNGYHPLWQLLLVPLAWLTGEPERLVALVVVVQGVIWVGLVREAMRIARHLGSEAAGLAAVAALGVIAVVTERVSVNGMEAGLLLLLLLMVLRVGLEAGDDLAPRVDWTLGALLALAFLTRLDAVLVTMPLALVLYRRGHRSLPWLPRRAVALLGPTVVTLAVYLLVNQLLFGSPTPVSGRAKSLGAPYVNTRALRDILDAGVLFGRPAWLGAAALVLLGTAWGLGHWRRHPAGRILMALALAIAAGQALFVAYLTFATSYSALPWYHFNTALILLCAGLLLADWCIAKLGSRGVRLCLVAAGAFLAMQAAEVFLTSDNTHTGGLAAADFVRSELPDDAVLAMGDRAGIFGFVADRPLLQIEGLMADEPFLHDLEHGTVVQRMAADGVDYYVRYSPRRDRRQDGRNCWELREPRVSRGPSFEVTVCQSDLVYREVDGDQELTIWRFRPEVN
jgi:hypothetical protein